MEGTTGVICCHNFPYTSATISEEIENWQSKIIKGIAFEKKWVLPQQVIKKT